MTKNELIAFVLLQLAIWGGVSPVFFMQSGAERAASWNR